MRGSHPVEVLRGQSRTLRLADRSRRVKLQLCGQHSGAAVHEAEIQLFFFLVLLFALLGAPLFGEPFLLPDFFTGPFTATISYDCRINSFSSSLRSASSRSSITHLYRPTYGAGRISSRSTSSAKVSGVHLKHKRRSSRPRIVKILPPTFLPTLKQSESPHCSFSVARGNERQESRMESTFTRINL